MNKLLEDFPVVVETPVAWGEMDAFQHVNNVVYFRYFENARIVCFDLLNMMAFKDKSGVGPILASTQCRFKIQLTYPDTVSIGTKIEELEEGRFVMKYAVVSHRLQTIAAEGDCLVVFFNYRENKKAPIPEELRQRILDMGKTEGTR